MKENRFYPEDLIRDIHACTPVYLERLLGRHALFVPGDGSVSMEALYKAANFMNLCGVHYENISPKDFCVCSIESGPCERVDVFHVSGRFWSTSACGEKRTPARPAWTSFPS